MTSTIHIEPAVESDLSGVAEIHNHYVLNTVMTFSEEPLPPEHFLRTYHQILSKRLPYLVALDPAAGPAGRPPRRVIGYAHAHSFRGGKGAYRHTVEITLFCHPEHTGRGVGSRLLRALLEGLKAGSLHSESAAQLGNTQEVPEIRQVLAIMALDETGKGGGFALRDFYGKFGFEVVGHLHQVGYKFGRW